VKLAVETLEKRISTAMAKAAGQKDCVALVKPATDPKFGDYQVNGVMPLAKSLKKNPRQLAEEVLENVDLSDICEQPEIAGPGFINLRLKPDFLAGSLLQINADQQNRLGVEKAADPKTIVVDFSCPNIAKPMHVGHLRSTIIGDCICRTLEFLGHKVIRQNHIGDWGTQFGMLVAFIERKMLQAVKGDVVGVLPSTLAEFETFYKQASELFDTDENFKSESHAAVVGLHSGDKKWIGRWEKLVAESEKHYQEIYDELNTTLKFEHTCGESFYRDMLADVVKELQDKGCAEESDGAVCVFPPGFKNKQGDPLPFIIQKSDGAYLYATTDLAAIRYRVGKLKADKIVYVTDARQKLHFEMLFAVGRLAGCAPENIELVHVMFGSVQGQDGKPLKTREGENVKLKDLLDEAVQRAKTVVEEKNPDLSAEKKNEIAKAVGIGAVKYADYSNNRTSDYIFSFDKMLAMDGNTAPYMQYAYARIKSIERKAQSREVDVETELAGIKSLNLTEPAELDLAKHLIRYGEAIQSAAADYRPNYLTGYLYELAQKFSSFYTDCPVLKAPPDKRPTRLLLCDLTRKTIKQGLSELLGIEVVEQM
jgi:arginyl-tRNA synthetase